MSHAFRFAPLTALALMALLAPITTQAQGSTHGDIRVSATVLSLTQVEMAAYPTVSTVNGELQLQAELAVRNNVPNAPLMATLLSADGTSTRPMTVTCGGSTASCGLPAMWAQRYPVTIRLTGLSAVEQAAYTRDPMLLTNRIHISTLHEGAY